MKQPTIKTAVIVAAIAALAGGSCAAAGVSIAPIVGLAILAVAVWGFVKLLLVTRRWAIRSTAREWEEGRRDALMSAAKRRE
jgi:hypothetical protein